MHWKFLSFLAIHEENFSSRRMDLTLTRGLSFVVFFLLLFLVYFFIKRMTGGKNAPKWGRHLRVIEKIPMGFDKSILIFELKGRYYIVYVDKNGLRVIDKRDDLDLEDFETKEEFKAIFSKWVSKRKKE